jgi:hypothetical protein
MMLLHSRVIAPAVPNWLIENARDLLESGHPTQASISNWNKSYTERDLKKSSGIIKNAFTHAMYLDHRSLEWARTHVTVLAKDIKLAFTRKGCTCTGPHVDQTRNFTLIYLLENGGDNHCTVWYREKNQQLIRNNGYHVDDYDLLQPIAHTKLVVHQWSLLNSKILHSVENISQGRLSIQIGLESLPDDLKLSEVVEILDE